MVAAKMTTQPSAFSGPSEWAQAYREHGLCVVPAFLSEDGKKKHPLGHWKEFTNSGMSDEIFNSLYNHQTGTHRARPYMGIITGMASQVAPSMGVLMIDIDVKDGMDGMLTFNKWLEEAEDQGHDTNIETWKAITGSGGFHLYFALEARKMLANTQSKLGGIDVRGQGGFVMCPPSPHYIQGKRYEWVVPPWEGEIQVCPDWLWQKLVDSGVAPGQFEETTTSSPPPVFGGPAPLPARTQTPTPDSARNAFGLLVDGRQKHMADVSLAVVTDLYRASPIRPHETKWEEIAATAYQVYAMGVDTRIPGVPKFEGLEREGRGYTAMKERVAAHMRSWDSTIKNFAAKEKPSGPFGEQQAAATSSFALQAQQQFQEEESKPFRATALKGKAPEREWLWKDWIPANAVTSLYGDGGVGKTLLAQQLAYSIAAGIDFLGVKLPKMPVVGAFCEDDKDELHRRHDDIVAANGGMAAIFDDVWLWPRVGYDNILVNFDRNHKPTLSPFFQHLCDEIQRIKPGLVILDTAADLFGGNEIIRFEANYFIKSVAGQLIKMAQTRGDKLSVLLLAHPSQSGKSSGTGESGSTGWNNAVRSRLYLKRPGPEDGMSADMRILTRMKSNYASAGDEENLHLMWNQGVLQVVGGGAANMGNDFQRKIDLLKTLVLDKVKEAWTEGNPYKERRGHPHEIHEALEKSLGLHGYNRAEIGEAIHQLIRDEDVVVGRTAKARGYKAEGQQ